MSIRKKIRKLIKKKLNSVSTITNRRYFRRLLIIHQKLLTERNTLMNHLDGEKILVFAPHVDDETIGCGGAILQYARNSRHVTIVFMTDSAKRGVSEVGKNVEDTRKDEAKEASRILGIPENQIHFLEGKDGDLKNSLEPEKFARILEDTAPDTIFLPAPIDTHPDHRAVSSLFVQWGNKYPKEFKQMEKQVSVYLYDVQSPMTQFFSNVTLDISNVQKKKRELLKVYRSQGNVLDFGGTMDKYYGMLYEIAAAEVYLKVSLSRFLIVTGQHMEEFDKRSGSLIKNENERTLKNSFRSSMKNKLPLLNYRD